MVVAKARRLALEEKRRQKAEEKQRQKLEFAEKEREVFEANEKRRRNLSEKLRREMREDITDAVNKSREEATTVANTKAMKTLFMTQGTTIVEQFSRGIGTPDGFPQHITSDDAEKEARRRFISQSVFEMPPAIVPSLGNCTFCSRIHTYLM